MSSLRKADLAIEARQEANRLDDKLKRMEGWGYGPEDPEYIKVAEQYQAKLAEAWRLWREWINERVE